MHMHMHMHMHMQMQIYRAYPRPKSCLFLQITAASAWPGRIPVNEARLLRSTAVMLLPPCELSRRA